MGNELAGKIAIVTGGASGIGHGTVERFVAEGARVVIADVNRESGESLAASCGSDARFKQTDVAVPDQVRDLVAFAVETFGGLHVMFNNAGISGVMHRRLLDDDFADFQRVMAVNLLGLMVGTQEAARHMATSGGGSIINISSIAGLQPGPGLNAYHASKAAVVMFSQSAAIDLGEYDIRVNCIAPGHIETPILASALPDMPDEAKQEVLKTIRGIMMSTQPLKRQGMPTDVAEAAVYFASDRSSFVTGTIFPIDGGTVAGAPPASNALEGAMDRSEVRA